MAKTGKCCLNCMKWTWTVFLLLWMDLIAKFMALFGDFKGATALLEAIVVGGLPPDVKPEDYNGEFSGLLDI